MRRTASSRCADALILSLVVLAWTGSGCSSYRAARLYQSGSAELRRGEYERALVDLERAAEFAPHASEVQNHLGLALVGVGREREAEAAFRHALALDCDNVAAAENLELIVTDAKRRSENREEAKNEAKNK